MIGSRSVIDCFAQLEKHRRAPKQMDVASNRPLVFQKWYMQAVFSIMSQFTWFNIFFLFSPILQCHRHLSPSAATSSTLTTISMHPTSPGMFLKAYHIPACSSLQQQGSFLHEHARPLNKRYAWRLTTGFAFIKMAHLKAIIAIILLVGLGECARDLTKCVVCKKKTLTWS